MESLLSETLKFLREVTLGGIFTAGRWIADDLKNSADLESED